MAKQKAKTLSQRMAEYQAEARRLAGSASESEKRMIKVGLSVGRELEPTGRLAGVERVPAEDPQQS